MSPKKPKIAVFKFASCDGCQLSLLDAEDELLARGRSGGYREFPGGEPAGHQGPVRHRTRRGEHHDAARRGTRSGRSGNNARSSSRSAPARRPGGSRRSGTGRTSRIYAASSTPRRTTSRRLTRSMPIGSYVHVDFELRGCPINKAQLLEVLNAAAQPAQAHDPYAYASASNASCAGHVCVMVAQRDSLPGTGDQAGCGAICPSYNRGCYGCFGPMENPNTASLAAQFAGDGNGASADIMLAFRGFNAYAEVVQEGERRS